MPIDWSGKSHILQSSVEANSDSFVRKDLAGRIAMTIFTRSHMNEKTNVLEGDVSCLDRDDPLRDALVTLNQISAK